MLVPVDHSKLECVENALTVSHPCFRHPGKIGTLNQALELLTGKAYKVRLEPSDLKVIRGCLGDRISCIKIRAR
jgi:hypothetical protein